MTPWSRCSPSSVSIAAKAGFTTWAYKFALLEAATIMRRQAWRRREVVLDADQWSRLPAVPTANAETAELLRAIATAAKGHLTVHQREVLVSLAFDGVPIDVLAERLNTTRNALYKTLHDARRKLRRQLTADGHLDAPTPDVIPA